MQRVHFSLQGKGGIGKSLVCRLLAEYDHGMTSFDADPINGTLSSCEGIDCSRIDLMDESRNDIDKNQIDALVDTIVEHENDVLIDTGASSFIPLQGYIEQHKLLEFLVDMGKEIWLHYVLVAGQAQMDCLESLGHGLRTYPVHTRIVTWENEYFGRLQFDLKHESELVPLRSTPLWNTNKARLTNHVVLDRKGDLFVHDVERYLQSGLTFAEIEADAKWSLMSRRRLGMTKQRIWSQLETVFAANGTGPDSE